MFMIWIMTAARDAPAAANDESTRAMDTTTAAATAGRVMAAAWHGADDVRLFQLCSHLLDSF